MKITTLLSKTWFGARKATPFVAMIGLLIAIFQLNSSNATRNADFAHKFKTDFFTDQTTYLIMLIDEGFIQFKTATDSSDSLEFGYFEVDTVKTKFLNPLKVISSKRIFTVYEMDTYILNLFDDLGEYYRRGIVDLDYVNEGFSYYVDCVYENKEIQKYLKWVNSDSLSKESYTYGNFEYIYNKLRRYSKKNCR